VYRSLRSRSVSLHRNTWPIATVDCLIRVVRGHANTQRHVIHAFPICYGVATLLSRNAMTNPALGFIRPSRADLAMRGLAISFLTLAHVVAPDSFLAFFFIEHPR